MSARSALKNWARAIYAPVSLSVGSGHLRSAITGKPVDRHGEPIPWLTYPIIDFLSARDFSQRAILEWGAGHSTLWWSKRAKSVVAYETDREWYEWLKRRVPSNVDIRLTSLDSASFNDAELTSYDVIVVDGAGERAARLQASIPHLAEFGAFIIDNTNDDKYSPMVGKLKSIGFSEIDFHGYIPGAAHRCTTSLLFRDRCFLTLANDGPDVEPNSE